MREQDYFDALKIISQYHSTVISINKPKDGFVGGLGKDSFTLHITQCVPAVVAELSYVGFRLSMEVDGLRVDK